jgi:hypothetical protein
MRSVAVALSAGLLVAGAAIAQDAPLFQRPFDGVPVGVGETFVTIVPSSIAPGARDGAVRILDPANLPARYEETVTTPGNLGITAGTAFLGQFIDHDVTLSLEAETEFLLPPFIKSLEEDGNGGFTNLRTPGLDLDSLYGAGPFEGASALEGWYDFDTGVGLRFRFGTGPSGALDFVRDPVDDRAYIGDERNDENGLVGQIHRAFQLLHNKTVDRILERDGINEMSLVPGSPEWWDVFSEARNYTTAYFQGVIGNDFMRKITGRSLFDALEDTTEPIGPLPQAQIPLEFAQGVYRLHTIVPNAIQIGSSEWVSPIDPVLRSSVSWGYLFGPRATPGSLVDTAVPAELRDIVSLVIPGVGELNLDLGQVNILRGRETEVVSGEAYLQFLLDELGLPADATEVRGKQVLNWASGNAVFTSPDDEPLMADLLAKDTDLWAYVMAEATLNGGFLGPVGQDILERTFGNLLLDDPWSLVGANSDQFTQEQLDYFKSATMDGLIGIIQVRGDLNNDDEVGAADLAMLLPNWGTDDLASDIDGDGVVGAADLAQLIGNWSN